MRLLVLRPERQGAATARRLAALGHDAIVSPILVIEPTCDAAPPGPFAAVIVTSDNARAAILGLSPRPAAPVWVVGRETAARLAQDGLAVAECARDAGTLATRIAAQVAPGRVLLVAGRDRAPEPVATLAALGFEVAVWEAYGACIVDALPELAVSTIRVGGLEAVLHYSPRSAAAALRLVHQAGLWREFSLLRHLCLSAAVARALPDVAPGRLQIAAAPDEAALFACLASPGSGAREV